MLAEFFDRIVGLARKSDQVGFYNQDSLPDVCFIRHGDELIEKQVPPPKRRHILQGFDDLVAVLQDPSMSSEPEVYLNSEGIVVLLARGDRTERVTINLAESKRLRRCRELEASPACMLPKDAVKLLRLEFHGGNHANVIQSLSRLDFTRSSAGKSHVDHGRESLGRSVEAAVQQADSVPREFLVGVPLWTNPGFARYATNIEFGLHLEVAQEMVELRVLSDECSRAVNQALVAVAGDIVMATDCKVPVFLGTP